MTNDDSGASERSEDRSSTSESKAPSGIESGAGDGEEHRAQVHNSEHGTCTTAATEHHRSSPEADDGVPVAPRPRDPTRYQIVAEHGRGGLGRVYRARDRELGRDVALKELLKPSYSAEVRFFREAFITARLEHPGIVPVHEAGRWPDGTPFYSMKLVAGRPLSDLLADAKTLDQRLALVPHLIAVADAIAYAHDRGIIHRDLKPSNVIVGKFGETIVIDWGLAKELASSEDGGAKGGSDGPYRISPTSDLTMAGSVLGTPAYMSPEQARGDSVDRRTDVYSLGAILLELCTGAAPTVGVAIADRRKELRGTPEDLATIALKAISTQPDDRYATAAEFAADLRSYDAGARIAARTYSLAGILKHWFRHHKRLALSIVVPLIVGSAVGAFAIREITGQRADAVAQRNRLILAQAAAALDSDPTLAIEWLKSYPSSGEDIARAQVIAADAVSRGVARHIVPAMSWTMSLSADGEFLVTAGPHDRVQLWRLDGGTAIASATFRSPVLGARFSPDGQTVAVADRSGEVVLWTPVTNSRRLLGRLDGGAFYVAFSGDGKKLGASGLKSVVVWSFPTGEQTWETLTDHDVSVLAMSSDGTTVAFGTSDGTLRIVNLATGVSRRLAGHTGPINALVITPDGKRMLSGGKDHTVRVWDLASGIGRLLGAHDGLVRDVRFSPTDPELMASGGADHQVRLWRLDGTVQVLAGHTDIVNAVMFSPDGRMLASTGPDRQVRLWDLASGDARVLRGHRGDLGDLAFSPDGQWLVSSGYDEGTRIWHMDAPAGRLLGRHELEALHAVFSPNGRFVASAGSDRTARLWDLLSGVERSLPRSEYTCMTYANGVVFSASGDLLASVGDSTAHLWNIKNAQDAKERSFVAPETALRRVSLSPDGKLLAAAGSDGTVRWWDVASGRATVRSGHTGEVTTVLFSPAGDFLVSGGIDGTIRRWTIANGEGTIVGAYAGRVTQLASTPDGATFVSGSPDGSIGLWNLATRTSRRFYGHDDIVSSLAFSHDGRLLASASMDKTVRVWEVATGRSRVLQGHDESVRAVAFSPDARLVATGSNDRSIRLWDLASGDMAVLRGHSAAVRSVAFDPDGRHLVSAGEDMTVRLWTPGRAQWAPARHEQLVSWMDVQTSANVSVDGIW